METNIKKIMLTTIGVVLGIAMISALILNSSGSANADEKTFNPIITANMSDFIKEDFNPKYGVITLKDSIEDKKIAEYSLTKNTDFCMIHCEAEGRVTLYQDRVIFNDVKFETLTGGLTSIQSYEYLLFDHYEDNFVDVPDTYKEVCENSSMLNETSGMNDTVIICNQVPATWKKENQPIEVWEKYNGEVLNAGEYRWKIKGVKDQMQSVDFIPIVSSKEFDEWATWTSSMNVGLVTYYNFNDSTEKVSGILNGTLHPNSIVNSSTFCIINSCLNTSALANNYTAGNSTSFNLRKYNTTINYWLYPITNHAYLLAGWDGGIWYNYYHATTSQFEIANICTASFVTGGNYPPNTLQMITMVNNGTNLLLYKNGVYIEKCTLAAQNTASTTLYIGYRPPTTEPGKNYFDELSSWNRTLTPSEISDLYNGEAGMTYIPDAPAALLNITGRVLDSNYNAIDGATVLILDSTGAKIANTTSNASGDWRYQFTNQTITNYTIVGYNPANSSQGGNAYPFFSA